MPDRSEDYKALVYSPDSRPFGKTYAEWSAKWWQLVLSTPVDENPVLESTGEHCDEGDAGRVFFLFGTFGGPVTRQCEVGDDQALFFPIINAACDTTPPPVPVDQLQSCARSVIDTVPVTSLVVTLNGEPIVADLTPFRFISPVFSFRLPEKNVYQFFGLDVPKGKYQGASDGYWLMLKPLPEGKHVLHFRGENPATGFEADVLTYHLTVD